MGPNYGHPFKDTGQSPTHDEWAAATAAGLPRLVYRKEGVEFEADQQEFARSIGDYTSGVFYDSFTTTPELLTKVAANVRELDQAGDPLSFSPLTEPVTVTWRADFDEQLQRRHSSSQPALSYTWCQRVHRPAPMSVSLMTAPARSWLRPGRPS